MTKETGPLRRLRDIAICMCMLLAGTSVAHAQESYLLRPGDILQLDIAGLPESRVTAPIGPDGSADLGHLGPLDVGGLRLAAARAIAQGAAERQPFRRYAEDGDIVVIAIRPEDVRLGIAAYRPVRIGGQVVNPGRYEFEPGMTARALIADAGGVESFADLAAGSLSLQDFIRNRADLDEAILAAARASIEIWSLRARLTGNVDIERPQVADPALRHAEIERLWSEAEDLARVDLTSAREEHAYLEESLREARERLDILTAQRTELREVVATDEEEAERVQELVSRGVAPTSRLIEIRRATAQSATRLLEVEESLSEARLEVIQLEREQHAIDEERRMDLLIDLGQARGRRLEAELNLRRGAILMSGTPTFVDPQVSRDAAEVTVVAYRLTDGQIDPVPLRLDDFLQPGDLLDVRNANATPDAGTSSQEDP